MHELEQHEEYFIYMRTFHAVNMRARSLESTLSRPYWPEVV